MFTRHLITAVLAGLCLVGSALAEPGLWHNPERDGHGISISQPGDGGHAVLWYKYRTDGTAAFLMAEPCPAFPCASPLFEPTARYLGGELDLGEPVGLIEIDAAAENRMRVYFDLREWTWPRCEGVSAGGVVWRECAGWITFHRLAD